MNPDYTHITLIVDRSGSMESIREEAEGGVNSFLRQQAGEPGRAEVTLVQFDTEYERVFDAVPVAETPRYVLQPRGMTALLDALGRSIVETGERLADMPPDERPGLVIFVVVTDGMENASREFQRDRIRDMIEHQQSVYSWRFIFLAANQDAFAEGASLGLSASSSAPYTADKIAVAYGSAGKRVSRMRRSSAALEDVDAADEFTAQERDEML